MYASRHSIHSWGSRHILKQSRNGPLESSKERHEIFKENKRLYAHIQEVRPVGDHWFFDSDFAGCQDSLKSTSCYIFMLAGGAVSWRNVKQTLTASSTMAAEFVACFETSNHGIWLRNCHRAENCGRH